MTKPVKRIALNTLYIIVVIALVFAVWAVAARIVDTPLIMPTVGDTFDALWIVVRLKTFWVGLVGTVVRSLIGYAVATALAFVLFFLSSLSDAAEHIITPIVAALRTLPTVAVSLVLVIWAGAVVAPVVLGVIVIAPMLYSTLRAKVATVTKELVEIARLNGAGNVRIFYHVVMPTAAGALPEGLATALSFNIKIVIAAEIVMQTANSLGMLMNAAQIYYMTATLIALVVVAVVISVAIEYLVRWILSIALVKYRD